MFKTIKTAALSALIGVATLSGMTAGARAEGLYFGFDNDGGARGGIVIGDNDDRYDNRGPRHRDRWDRNRRACTPERALDKAERIGLRRARIVDVDRRTIEVAGRRHGDRVHITFARAPNCPVIR